MKLRHVYRFITRNYRFNLLWTITIISTLVLLFQLQYDISRTRTSLTELSDNTKVTATLHIKSNSIDYFPYKLVQDLYDTGFIEHSDYSSIYKSYVSYPYSNLSVNFNYEKVVVDSYSQDELLAITSIDVLDTYQTILEQALLDSLVDKNWIVVDKGTYEENKLSIGDELILSGEYIPTNYHETPENAYARDSLIGVKFIVVGTFDGLSPNLPIGNIRYIANNHYILDNFRNYIINETIPEDLYPFIGHDINPIPYVNYAEFTLCNKLELNKFKKIVTETILPRFYHYELVIDDSLHEVITSPIQKQIQTKENILLLVISVLMFIQFLITFIASYRKISLIALLRISGNSKYAVFFTIITEQIIICIISNGIFFLYLFVKDIHIIQMLSSRYYLIFYLAYAIGIIISTMIILSKAPMSLLLKKE